MAGGWRRLGRPPPPSHSPALKRQVGSNSLDDATLPADAEHPATRALMRAHHQAGPPGSTAHCPFRLRGWVGTPGIARIAKASGTLLPHLGRRPWRRTRPLLMPRASWPGSQRSSVRGERASSDQQITRVRPQTMPGPRSPAWEPSHYCPNAKEKAVPAQEHTVLRGKRGRNASSTVGTGEQPPLRMCLAEEGFTICTNPYGGDSSWACFIIQHFPSIYSPSFQAWGCTLAVGVACTLAVNQMTTSMVKSARLDV